MDFGALPPETNSARMYSGPGSGPMLAAATAWEGLATQLHSAATSYGSVVSGLTGGAWLGPSSASMAAAAAPYVAWLHTTAAHAEQVAAQARAAAAAYETAFAMTVPPPVIAANRSQLMSLVATNILGQNTPAIAATEAHYGAMWAQDITAMYGYAASAATATEISPLSPPPQTTNPAGSLGQASSVAQAAGTSAGSHTELSQVIAAVPQALHAMTTPAAATAPSSSPSPLSVLQMVETPVATAVSGTAAALTATAIPLVTTNIGFTAASLAQKTHQQPPLPPPAAGQAPQAPAGMVSAPSAGWDTAPRQAPISAGMGRAPALGALSVPQSWTAKATPASIVTAALRNAGLGAAPAASAAEAPTPALSGGLGLPMAGMASAGLGGAAGSNLGTRARRDKPDKSEALHDYRTAIATTLGYPAVETGAHSADTNITGVANEDESTTEHVTLTRRERDILEAVRRYIAGH